MVPVTVAPPHKATRKEKKAVLDEFTRLTGYHRKSAVRLLGAKPARQATVHANGHAVKLKPGKRRPGNRKGRPVYGDEVIGSLVKVWAFFCTEINFLLTSRHERASGNPAGIRT